MSTIAFITALAALVSLVLASLAEFSQSKKFFGITQEHWYNDAKVEAFISIAFGILLLSYRLRLKNDI
uniref:Uncharacterized protein n=1 Tax=Marseillevirus LCMAC101 TaxID=2506602 RepID=A0A481YSQ4_9VIRU|nr:MAG: hypothetical protein LCMAC101_06150 [Marseillevirus LCMAC101]